MANIYKFKLVDERENKIKVLASKGEKGEKGDTGEVSQAQLDNVQAQIDGLASGSPLVASSTSGMTDTTRVYVNTTDGYWYYYNGTNWVQGGIYQSTGIGDNSINIKNIDNSLLYKNYDKSIIDCNIGGFDPNTGELLPSTTNRCCFIIDDITTPDYIYTILNSSLILTAIGEYNDSVFKGGLSVNLYESYANGYLINRGNYTKLICVYRKSDNSNFTNDEISSLKMYLFTSNKYQQENLINSIVNEKINFVYGAIDNIGRFITNTIRIRTNLININEKIGYKYLKINGLTNNMYVRNITFYDNDTFIVQYTNCVKNKLYYGKNFVKIYQDGTFNQIGITVSKYGENTDFTDEELEDINLEILPTEISKWSGKKYVALGDSITYGFIPRNYTGYPGQLNSYAKITAQKLNMNFVNSGISGNTIAPATGGGTPMCERYEDLPDDADLITVMGGTNDIRKGVTLGDMDDRTSDTFYGALHILMQGLYKKYFIDQGTTKGKEKKIIILTPIKLLQNSASEQGGTGTLVNLEPWCQAIKDVANYYSFPVLDMYNLSGINPHLNETIQGTETGYTGYYNPYITDGTHPTQEGAEIMANVLAGFLNTL